MQAYLKRFLNKNDEVLPKSFRVSDVRDASRLLLWSTDFQKPCVIDAMAHRVIIAGPVRTAGATIGASVIALEDSWLTRPS